MKTYTKEEKAQIIQQFKDAEARVMEKIRVRMSIIQKSPRLRKKVEKEIHEALSKHSK